MLLVTCLITIISAYRIPKKVIEQADMRRRTLCEIVKFGGSKRV